MLSNAEILLTEMVRTRENASGIAKRLGWSTSTQGYALAKLNSDLVPLIAADPDAYFDRLGNEVISEVLRAVRYARKGKASVVRALYVPQGAIRTAQAVVRSRKTISEIAAEEGVTRQNLLQSIHLHIEPLIVQGSVSAVRLLGADVVEVLSRAVDRDGSLNIINLHKALGRPATEHQIAMLRGFYARGYNRAIALGLRKEVLKGRILRDSLPEDLRDVIDQLPGEVAKPALAGGRTEQVIRLRLEQGLAYQHINAMLGITNSASYIVAITKRVKNDAAYRTTVPQDLLDLLEGRKGLLAVRKSRPYGKSAEELGLDRTAIRASYSGAEKQAAIRRVLIDREPVSKVAKAIGAPETTVSTWVNALLKSEEVEFASMDEELATALVMERALYRPKSRSPRRRAGRPRAATSTTKASEAA